MTNPKIVPTPEHDPQDTYTVTPYVGIGNRPTDKINVRTYADGCITYGCGDCDFHGAFWQTVGAHRRKVHNAPSGKTLGRPAKGAAHSKHAKALAMIQQGVDILSTLDDKDEDSWKARALKAERQIKTLRSLFKED